jgi:hypothetical protein
MINNNIYVREGEMGRTCNKRGGEENVEFLWESQKERDH